MLLLTSCSFLFTKPLIDELPNEDIFSVVRVYRDIEGEDIEIETELSEENINSFHDSLKDLRFKERKNFWKIKTRIYDSVHYIITYDNNYTVKLSEHHLLVLNNGEKVQQLSFDNMLPNDAFDEIDKLFEN
jgi:hypothetical protein